MASLPLFRIFEAILAQARSLILGDRMVARPARTTPTPFAPRPDTEREQGVAKQDKGFWTNVAAADRRLTELRRAIDQAEAVTTAREVGVKASPGGDPHLGESRYETAKRVIIDALGAEKS